MALWAELEEIGSRTTVEQQKAISAAFARLLDLDDLARSVLAGEAPIDQLQVRLPADGSATSDSVVIWAAMPHSASYPAWYAAALAAALLTDDLGAATDDELRAVIVSVLR
jgi:hypothetical protein